MEIGLTLRPGQTEWFDRRGDIYIDAHWIGHMTQLRKNGPMNISVKCNHAIQTALCATDQRYASTELDR